MRFWAPVAATPCSAAAATITSTVVPGWKTASAVPEATGPRVANVASPSRDPTAARPAPPEALLEGSLEQPGGFGVEHAGDRGLGFEGERGSQVGGGDTVEHALHGLCGEGR